MDETRYVLRPEIDKTCPLDHSLKRLEPEDADNDYLPRFWVCFTCEGIFQIGIGIVKKEYNDNILEPDE